MSAIFAKLSKSQIPVSQLVQLETQLNLENKSLITSGISFYIWKIPSGVTRGGARVELEEHTSPGDTIQDGDTWLKLIFFVAEVRKNTG